MKPKARRIKIQDTVKSDGNLHGAVSKRFLLGLALTW